MPPAIFGRFNASVLLPALHLGDRNFSVILLQQALYLTGFYRDAIDGIFGEVTLTAVKAFQEANNLVIDGVVNAETWEQIAIEMEMNP